jgi:hypothetical protein
MLLSASRVVATPIAAAANESRGDRLEREARDLDSFDI